MTMVALLGATGVASADRPESDCPHEYRPRHPVKPRKPVVPPTKPPCECKGTPGEQGPPGPKGPPGRSGSRGDDGKIVVVYSKTPIGLSLGIMGTIQGPHGDWAWGPALQLTSSLSERYELSVQLGLAAGASDGRESGHLLQVSVKRDVEPGVGLSLGIHSSHIRGSSDNGNIDGDYLGLSGGLVLHTDHIRFEVGPTIGGLRDDNESWTQLAFGVQGSTFVGWAW